MYLLNTSNAELTHFVSPERAPAYAILSHVWGENEQSSKDLQKASKRAHREGLNTRDIVGEKIRRCCELAEADGFQWVWIDTCCIDKTSSAELSEAINSMYRYYTLASVCYAYLEDVTDEEAALIRQDPAFPLRTIWTSRGWTLQELIAPSSVILLSTSWKALGSKADLAEKLEVATGGIPVALLRTELSLDHFCIAQRMSWATSRETTRVEDEAYCLLGLFGINMPTLYGEGRNAFQRLQEEIMRRISEDTTLFAWGLASPFEDFQQDGPPDVQAGYVPRLTKPSFSSLLADAPAAFDVRDDVTYTVPVHGPNEATMTRGRTSFSMTSHGVRARCRLTKLKCGTTLMDLGWSLSTSDSSNPRKLPIPAYLVVELQREPPHSDDDIPMYQVAMSFDWNLHYMIRIVYDVSEDDIWSTRMADIYIANDITSGPQQAPLRSSYPCNSTIHSPFHIRILRVCHNYVVTDANHVGLSWRGRPPAVLRMFFKNYGRFTIHLGICTTSAILQHNQPGAGSGTLIHHWVRVSDDLRVNSPAIQDLGTHICSEDHINLQRTGQDRVIVPFDVRGFERTIRVKLVFIRSPINPDTVILDSCTMTDIL